MTGGGLTRIEVNPDFVPRVRRAVVSDALTWKALVSTNERRVPHPSISEQYLYVDCIWLIMKWLGNDQGVRRVPKVISALAHCVEEVL